MSAATTCAIRMDINGDGMGALVHQLHEAVQNAPAVKGMQAVMQWTGVDQFFRDGERVKRPADDQGWPQGPGATGISKGAHE